MTAKELKRFLAHIDDDTKVVLSTSDHGYYPVGLARVVDAEVDGRYFLEYEGDENKSDPSAPVVKVCLIS